jgi:hypothetical protein
MDDFERDQHLIEGLERMDLPPMPVKIRAMIDAGPPYLAQLLRALADDMEQGYGRAGRPTTRSPRNRASTAR